MPSTPTEAKHTPWSVSLPKYPNQYLVRLFDAQDRLVASSSWHDASPHYPTKAQSIDNFERIAAAINERSSLLSLMEDMAKSLDEVANMSNRQIGVPTDTEAAHEHAMIAQSMSETARSALSRYTEFMEKNNG